MTQIKPDMLAKLVPLGVFEEDGRLYIRIEAETYAGDPSQAKYEVLLPCEGRSGHVDTWLMPLHGSVARSRLQTYDYEFSNGGPMFRAAVRKAWDIAKTIKEGE